MDSYYNNYKFVKIKTTQLIDIHGLKTYLKKLLISNIFKILSLNLFFFF